MALILKNLLIRDIFNNFEAKMDHNNEKLK